MAIKTYLDSNVLINIFVDDAATVQRAQGIITDPNRTFVVSDYVNDLFDNSVSCRTSLAIFHANALQNCGF